MSPRMPPGPGAPPVSSPPFQGRDLASLRSFLPDIRLQVCRPSTIINKNNYRCELIADFLLLHLRRQTVLAGASLLRVRKLPPRDEVSVMNTWTRTLLVGAALLAGCEGS